MEKLSPGFKLGKFELKVDERGFGKVFIDGIEVPKVTRVEVICKAGELPIVRVDLLASEFLIELDKAQMEQISYHVGHVPGSAYRGSGNPGDPIPEPPQVGSSTSFAKIDKECPCGCGSTTPLAQSALSADGIGNDVLIKP